MKQHASNCRNFSDHNRTVASAVVKHCNLGPSIDFENSCVIYPESHMTKRKIAEALLISRARQNMHLFLQNMTYNMQIYFKNMH
jgi:hypothetical protein